MQLLSRMYEMDERNAVARAGARPDRSLMGRFSDLAPEEIAGAILLVLAIALVAVRPSAVTRLFESPYATPAPGGGPALQFLRSETPRPSPASDADTTSETARVITSHVTRVAPAPIARLTPAPHPTLSP
jgi:hypothetical protein